MSEEHNKPWQPLTPHEVMAVFQHAEYPWWIAGGFAIEHAAGRQLRPHGDIDVLLLRSDHISARATLSGWDCWAADPPGTLRPWRIGETLPLSVSDIWCRADCDSPWRLQLMLDDGDDGNWRSRRCPFVTKPIAELGSRDAQGIPFLAPEVQLFYKAKTPRHNDILDFAAMLPLLSRSQREWLRDAIMVAYGRDNAWLQEIDRGVPSRNS